MGARPQAAVPLSLLLRDQTAVLATAIATLSSVSSPILRPHILHESLCKAVLHLVKSFR